MSFDRALDKEQIFHVGYLGYVQPVQSGKESTLRANDDSETHRIFTAQNLMLADMGLYPNYIEPAKAGGLLVRCKPSEASMISDVLFGVSSPVRSATKSNVMPADEQKDMSGLRSVLMNAFGSAVSAKVEMPKSISGPFMAAAANFENVIRPVFAPKHAAPQLMAA